MSVAKSITCAPVELAAALKTFRERFNKPFVLSGYPGDFSRTLELSVTENHTCNVSLYSSSKPILMVYAIGDELHISPRQSGLEFASIRCGRAYFDISRAEFDQLAALLAGGDS